MDYSQFDDLVVDVSEGVARWRIDRPEKLNAMRTQTFHEIMELGRMLQADDDVRAVVATGAGRGFSSGADVGPPAEGETPRTPTRAERNDPVGVSGIAFAMSDLDKPAIAAVDGVAAGAGMALACSFDMRILGEGARFLTVFVRRALAPDCGLSWFLPRLVGPAVANELFFTSREVGAEEAVRIGLGNELVDDAEGRAMELARELAQAPPLSLLYAKREVMRSSGLSLREAVEVEWAAQGRAGASGDAQEGRASFVEKRAPRFTGQ
ncbi:MAG: enoyl-CoA hydratase-related protein [Dehalococcoidia bacterium]